MAPGTTAEAEVIHRAALETRQTLLHDEHPDTARSLLALGRTLLGRGRPEEAEPLLRKCLERQARAVPVNPLRLADAQGELGYCLTSLRRFEEAEELVLQGYENLRATLGDAHQHVKRKSLRLRELATTCEEVPHHVTQRATRLERATFSLEG